MHDGNPDLGWQEDIIAELVQMNQNLELSEWN